MMKESVMFETIIVILITVVLAVLIWIGIKGRGDAGASALAEERKSEIERLNGDLSRLRSELNDSAEQRRKDVARIASLETKLSAEQEKVKDMGATFERLSDKVLKNQGEEFSKKHIKRLAETLKPFKERIGNFEQEIKAMHNETIRERATLKNEVETLTKRSETISKEANELTRALKSDQQKQGAWGEMVLSNILERSGLREGAQYKAQVHRTSAEGERLRPDVEVWIPGGKSLVIDSKVSLNAYSEAINAENDADIAIARKRHVQSLRTHIKELSKKGYQDNEYISGDYVILFVPIESAFSEALREDSTLTEYALEQDIMIATPTTLITLLRTVSNLWAVERRNRNAEKIAERAGRIYEKVAGFVTNMDDVGKKLGMARESYDKAVGQLSKGRGNVLDQIEQLKELGATTRKSIKMDFDQENVPEQIEASEPPLISNEENEE